MSGGLLLQALVSGLSAGAVIGLVALGFTLVAGTVRVLHLAHGDVVVASALVAVLAVVGRTPVAAAPGLGASLLLVVLMPLVGALVACMIAVAVLRPARSGRSGDPLGWVVGGVAAGLLIRTALGAVLPGEAYAVPDPLRLSAITRSGLLDLPGGASIPVRTVAVLVLALGVSVAVDHAVTRTGLGLSLRAVADDPDAAALCGVPVGRVVLIAFAVAGLLAGVAGLLTAPAHAVSVDDGVVLGLEAVAAALLGGLGSLRGAVVGGLAVGVLQAMTVQVVGAASQDVAPLALLVVLLAIGPRVAHRRAAPA